MADKSTSSGEQYKKKSNRFLWLLGLGLIILAGVAYCSLSGGNGGRPQFEENYDWTSNKDTRLQNTKGDFDEFRMGSGVLEAQPSSVVMEGVVLGSHAEAIVTLTARQVPIQFIGMELAEEQQDGFKIEGTCEPNKVIQKDSSCTLKILWNPSTLRQLQNTLNIRWREDDPGVFSDSTLALPIKAQSTDSKDCVICETPCKDKEAEIVRQASLFDGTSGEVDKDNQVTIGDKKYTIKDNLLIDENGKIVGIVEPERIPIGLDNKLMGTISKTGDVLGTDGKALGRLLGDGTIVDSALTVLGVAVPVDSVMDSQGKIIGKVMKDGTVIDGAKTVIGRPLVDGSVADLEGNFIGYIQPHGLVVNWTGDVIGGIVSDGSIVNGSAQIIGSVKPNGMALNPNKELIGGVVPEGIAVGAACKALGRVQQNGQVKDSFSQIVGKTLLNGAVVDEKGTDVGTVIRMGLVINEKGDVVGFVNSEGKAVDSKGAMIGCVNPDSTVMAGTKMIGAVMPKGFVIGRKCELLGSVYPNGVAMNTAVEVIGQVRPDAHVVNVNNRIIGVVVPRGAAIADGCRLLGLITPDGRVIDENGLFIGCMTPEKQIVNRQDEVIGFVAPMGLVVNKAGAVIGRTRPDGKVIDNDGKVIGCVNSDGSVASVDGKTIIGQVVGSVPGDGVVLDENGAPTGLKVVGTDVFDETGTKVGTLLPNNWIVNNKGEIIGVIPPDGVIFGHDGTILGRYSRKTGVALTASGERFGFVLPDYSVLNTEKTAVIGLLIPDKTPFMTPNGGYLATMSIEGILQNESGESLGVIKSDGTVVDRAGQIIGVRVPQGKVFSVLGKEVGTVNEKGEVISPAQTVIGRVLGNGLALSNDGRILGGIFPDISLPIGADGLLGALTYQARINDTRGRQVGIATPFGTIFSEKENLSGRLVRIGPYIDTNGQLVGWANFKGGLNNKSGEEIGTITVAGVAIDSENRVLGTLVPRGAVVTDDGSYLAAVSTNGQVSTVDGQNKGFVNGYNYVSNEKSGVVGQLLPAGVVVNAEGGFIGWTRFDGAVEDGRAVIGRVTLDGRVIHADGSLVGSYIPLGTLVMNGKSGFMGVVGADGSVVNNKGDKIGTLMGNRFVFNNGRISGRLMQSSMAIKNLVSGRLIGMGGADGVTMVVNDKKPLGRLMANGLAVDLAKEVMGGLAPVGLPIATKLNVMGIGLPTGLVVAGGKEIGSAIGTEQGVVYSSEGQIVGGILPPGTFIDRNGAIIGRSSGTALIVNKDGKKLAEYMPFGSALTPDTIWAGGIMPEGLTINDDGYDIGVVALDGTIIGKDGMMMGRILSDGTAVGLSDKSLFSTMPYAGHTVKQGLPFGYKNLVLGRTTISGDIIDSSDKKVYRELDDGTILGNEMPVDGAVLSFNPATGHEGNLLGVLDGAGSVKTYAGEESGKIAVNGSVKGNHKYRILGALIPEQLVANECKVVGQTSYNGQIVNGQGSVVGRITPGKWAVDMSGNRIGRSVRVGLVSAPNGDYLGRTLPDSTVVDLNGVNMGCARNDGSVVNGSGEVIGHVVERGLVLDEKGNPIGRVKHDGIVVDKAGKAIGKVLGDGKGTVVDSEGKVIGRVVTPDEELMFNKDGTIAGTFNQEGMFKDPKGVEQFQVLPDGTIIDPKTGRKIAQLTKDGRLLDINGNEIGDIRVIRDAEGNFIGLVDDNGNIINFEGEKIGTVDPDGTIRDLSGKVMEGLILSGVDLSDVAPSISSIGGGVAGGRRIFLGDKVFDVTPQGSLVDKDGNIIGYMGEDGRPYSLDDRLLSGPEEKILRPDIKKTTPIQPEHRDAMEGLLGQRRAAMKTRIRSFERMLPDVRTLAKARKKEDLDWGEAKTVSTYPVDMSRMILKDKAIPVVLAHSVDSRFGDVPVTAIVERHIYAERGRRIIIPAGSRLIGTGGSGGGGKHVNKLNFTWERLIRPDGSAFKFTGQSGDAMGRGGVPAYLDEQLLKKYGRPVLESTITSAIAFITATNDDITNKENGDQVLSSRAQAANDARSNFIDSMSQIFNQLLQEALEVQEILYVPAGTRMTVYPSTDLWLRSEIEDEQDYLAAFGADTKRAKGSSKGNWVDGRTGEVAEMAAERGMISEAGYGVVTDENYYDPSLEGLDPDRAGSGGGTTLYNGTDEGTEETEDETEPSKPAPKASQVVEPIFPKQSGKNTGKKLF